MGSPCSYCTVILFSCIAASTQTTPWITKQCIQIADGYDCGGLALQSVPDEISESSRTLDFSFNYLPALYNTTFQRLKNLVLLDLTRCSITFVYEDTFHHQPKLKTLILVGNLLVFIADSAFSGPEGLQHLSLASSMIRSLKDIPTANLMLLETLDLSGSDIQFLEGLNNFNFQLLKRLNLDLNSIERIGAADLQALQTTSGIELSFKGNDLEEVEPKAFQGLDLGSLDFSSCFSKMNTSVLLKGLEGLKTTKLNLGIYEDSPKSYVTSAGLQSFCNISVLQLGFQLQHFSDLTEMSFQCLSGLQMLDLTRAHLSIFPQNLSNLPTLSHLKLDENRFEDICQIHAANFPMLTHLSISENNRDLFFTENCLEPLSRLEVLDLSHSGLSTKSPCCNKQLSGLSNLKLLNLSYNFAMNWEPLPFSSTLQLNHLDLTWVVYNLSSPSPFSNLLNLHTLNLSWSSSDLSSLPNLLKGLENLWTLNLKGNAIQSGVLTNGDSFNHVPLLEKLILSGCSITGLGKNVFKGLRKLTYVDLSENHLTTPSVSAFYSLKQIQLNFAKNAIAEVDIEGFEGLGETSSIDLSYNPLACTCSNYQFINWVKANANKIKHIQETRCNSTKQKIVNVDLHCTVSNHTLKLTLTIVVVIAVVLLLFFILRKRKCAAYSRL
ncbi:CD180 antigen [Astyanax mexicanus]|uniref:CD180 antigen n=1 Tax=Astyanax mexicanus TaxID=7994 RepID=UPI0020CB1538|nr:CD180 antigen [Astyanax mexicanus]